MDTLESILRHVISNIEEILEVVLWEVVLSEGGKVVIASPTITNDGETRGFLGTIDNPGRYLVIPLESKE